MNTALVTMKDRSARKLMRLIRNCPSTFNFMKHKEASLSANDMEGDAPTESHKKYLVWNHLGRLAKKRTGAILTRCDLRDALKLKGVSNCNHFFKEVRTIEVSLSLSTYIFLYVYLDS